MKRETGKKDGETGGLGEGTMRGSDRSLSEVEGVTRRRGEGTSATPGFSRVAATGQPDDRVFLTTMLYSQKSNRVAAADIVTRGGAKRNPG